jgi:hypothetical protein
MGRYRQGPNHYGAAVSCKALKQSVPRLAHWHCGTGGSRRAAPGCSAEQTWREPAISPVLCRSNGLSVSGVGISRIGNHRIDCLGCANEMVVSLRRAFPRGRRLHYPLTNETTICLSQLCLLVRAQWAAMVRATVADSMASRVGRAWHRLLLRIFLVRNPS